MEVEYEAQLFNLFSMFSVFSPDGIYYLRLECFSPQFS
jgi:hypothetical protein